MVRRRLRFILDMGRRRRFRFRRYEFRLGRGRFFQRFQILRYRRGAGCFHGHRLFAGRAFRGYRCRNGRGFVRFRRCLSVLERRLRFGKSCAEGSGNALDRAFPSRRNARRGGRGCFRSGVFRFFRRNFGRDLLGYTCGFCYSCHGGSGSLLRLLISRISGFGGLGFCGRRRRIRRDFR